MSLTTKVYYWIRPVLPQFLRGWIHRTVIQIRRKSSSKTWPIDPRAAQGRPPWEEWPENKRFALVLTHDVESVDGLSKCLQLMKMEKEMGFRSSFNFVAKKYTTPDTLRDELISNGFEVGVHGLLHDGKLYNSKHIFRKRAKEINQCLKKWNAVGFRSPSMHHNLEWIHQLNILYDASTFDTDPFEPDHSGMRTIFPFWVPDMTGSGGYAELPYTLPQDSTLFLGLKEKDITIWKQKLDWVVQHGGMVLVNTHPDYMNFTSGKPPSMTYPSDFYRELLEYILSEYSEEYWHPLPQEMASFTTEALGRHSCTPSRKTIP